MNKIGNSIGQPCWPFGFAFLILQRSNSVTLTMLFSVVNNGKFEYKPNSLLWLIWVGLFIFSCSKEEVQEEPTLAPPNNTSVHLTLGNSSGATPDVANPFNYLMIKPQYALSYHKDRGTSNWVSCHLDNSWTGTAARQDDFRSDMSLTSGWYSVQATDYSGSGFDRGHNTPSADRNKSIEDNSATFLMTNMIP